MVRRETLPEPAGEAEDKTALNNRRKIDETNIDELGTDRLGGNEPGQAAGTVETVQIPATHDGSQQQPCPEKQLTRLARRTAHPALLNDTGVWMATADRPALLSLVSVLPLHIVDKLIHDDIRIPLPIGDDAPEVGEGIDVDLAEFKTDPIRGVAGHGG